MGDIDAVKKQAPRITPVFALGACAVVSGLAVGLMPVMNEMQIKAKSVGLDYFDGAKLILIIMGLTAINITSFMNRSYSRYKDEKEKHDTEIRRLTETEIIAKKKSDSEGHLR